MQTSGNTDSAPALSAAVVIATLNRPTEIRLCIDSLMRQSNRPARIVVVDAGDLAEVADELSSICEAEGVTFDYRREKPSTTRQRNVGAECVAEDVVFFLDDDVQLEPHYVEHVLRQYADDTAGTLGGATGVPATYAAGASVVMRMFCQLFFLAETRDDVAARLKRSGFPLYSRRLSSATECEIMASTAVSYRLAVFRQHLFDQDLTGYVMAEDIDLSYRVSRTFRLIEEPAAVYSHAKSPVARNSRREAERRRVLFTQYFFRKNLGRSIVARLSRCWALCGLLLFHAFRGLRNGNFDRLSGTWDGLRCARKNKLLIFQRFEPGPLEH